MAYRDKTLFLQRIERISHRIASYQRYEWSGSGRCVDITETRPNYLAFSGPTFIFGFMYQQLVNHFSRLSALQVEIIFVARK